MRGLTVLLLAICSLVLTGTAISDTIVVDPSGTGDYPTIQEAITAAASGDTILLLDGTYTGTGNRDLQVSKTLTIRSDSDNPEACIIDCEGASRGIDFYSGITGFLMEGVTIANGYDPSDGGAIFCFMAGCDFRNCHMIGCQNGAVFIYEGFGTTFEDCEFVGNSSSYRGGAISVSGIPQLSLLGCDFADNSVVSGRGGALYAERADALDVENCTFLRNAASGDGGAICLTVGLYDVTIASCLFQENTAGGYGGALSNDEAESIEDCVFLANSAEQGGAVFSTGNFTVSDCTITGNRADHGGGGILFWGGYTEHLLTNCTVSGNYAGNVGGGIYMEVSSVDIALQSTILWGNCAGSSGDELYTERADRTVSFECCDTDSTGIDGPSALDWSSGDNIFVDPRFCGPLSCDEAPTIEGSYFLWDISPCLNVECGPIGDLGAGCIMFDEHPQIEDIRDVENDQGGQLRLTWRRSVFDAPGDTIEVTGYGVYRRQDQYLRGSGDDLRYTESKAGDRLEGWDVLVWAPARGDSIYQYVAPTLCDSTADHGICWSVFFISATTSDPLIYYDSPPDSSYSIDNLSPAPPSNLRWAPLPVLVWDESAEEDFNYFTVYGSSNEVHDETAELIGYTIETSIVAEGYDFYHVSATDFAGNEGDVSTVEDISSVSGDVIPDAFGFGEIRPNPVRSLAVVTFDLPSASMVNLDVYDITGRRIRRLADGSWPAGRHTVEWLSHNDATGRIPSGVYYMRFSADDFQQTRQVVVLE